LKAKRRGTKGGKDRNEFRKPGAACAAPPGVLEKKDLKETRGGSRRSTLPYGHGGQREGGAKEYNSEA